MDRRTVILGGIGISLATAGQALGSRTRVRSFPARNLIDSVGVNIHLSHRNTPYFDNFEAVKDALSRLGIRHIRDAAYFVEGVDRDFIAYQRTRELARLGLRLCLICMDRTNPYYHVEASRVPEIVDWCGGAVELIEGSNEPDLTRNPRRDIPVSRDAHRALHAAVRKSRSTRHLPVLGPSYVQKSLALAAPLRGLADFANIHPYPGGEPPETDGPGSIDRQRVAARRLFGAVPAMATESGYHTALRTTSSFLPVSEAIRARYLPRLILYNFLRDVRRTYIYELIESFPTNDATPESRFGLLRYDGTPTPAWHAVRNLIRLFSPQGSATPARPAKVMVEARPDLFAASFQVADGRQLLALWRGVRGWDQFQRKQLPETFDTVEIRIDAPRSVSTRYSFEDDGALTRTPFRATTDRQTVRLGEKLTVIELR